MQRPQPPPLPNVTRDKLESSHTTILRLKKFDLICAAISNCDSEDLGLEFVRVLVEHGVDINRAHPWFGDKELVFTPLSWALENGKTMIADYLRSHGGRVREAIPGVDPAPTNGESGEIVKYFEEHFGIVHTVACWLAA
jgi:hypothetical protein